MRTDHIALAARLSGEAVLDATRIRAGGNNELYRIRTTNRHLALKCYPANDERDRIGREYGALSFLWAVGERAVPEPIAIDRATNSALYAWIPGERLPRFGSAEIGQALGFLTRVHTARTHLAAAALPDATEACFDVSMLESQVEKRRVRLAALEYEPAVRQFLAERFAPLWARALANLRSQPSLARDVQTLSPSDFGVHNALRRPDGELVFLDFEYFGWDDPVKLTADTLWHPGSAFGEREREAFRAGASAIYGADPAFATRLAAYEPAYGLRWALIALAEFLPERWERRRAAGDPGAWDAAKARQLAKAEAFVERCAQLLR